MGLESNPYANYKRIGIASYASGDVSLKTPLFSTRKNSIKFFNPNIVADVSE
jgi:hypothetical protein